MFYYSIFNTKLGYMGAVASAQGLHMIILPQKSEKEVKQELEAHYTDELIRNDKKISFLADKINAYYNGGQPKFKITLDSSGITPFEMKVWDAVNGIPYGEVRSYDWVARQVGSAGKVRAVGQALKRNRFPIIIPCHRVINKSGDLGGFSGGIELKRKLLKIEGRIW